MTDQQHEPPAKKPRPRKPRGRSRRGEGSIFTRVRYGKLVYVAQITLDNGKKKQTYHATEKEAVAARRKLLNEQEQGLLITERDQTTARYLEYWLESVHKRAIRLGSYIRYRGLLNNHILPALGSVKLRQLSPQRIDAFYTHKLEEGLSASSIASMHGLLHQALKDAVRRNLVPRNVCDSVTPPRQQRREAPSLTKDQAQKLLETARGHRLEVLLTMALTTGMRRGELLALRWQDINWEDGSLQVRRSVNRYATYGYKVFEPKTPKSRRKIMLPRFVLDILKQHRAVQLETRLKAGTTWQDQDLVFCNEYGNFIRPDHMVVSYQKLLQDAGLPRMHFHDLRHSAATILLTMGVHPKVVQELLGHSQISMTMDTYSHVLPTMQREAMNGWDDLLGGPI